MNEKILVVDDDEKIRRLLKNCFEPEGYVVYEAANGNEVKNTLAEQSIDLITLDLNLGGENGLTIASEVKASCDIPIIIVTGKGDVIDKVVGLEMGADDYISKPFHVREVIARVRSVLRRAGGSASRQSEKTPEEVAIPRNQNLFEFDGWIADPAAFELKQPDGSVCDMTTADFKLLMVLLKHPRRVLSRDQIMDHLNGVEWSPYDRTIDNQIARLRKKIEEDPASPRYIKTVRGVGYTFASNVTTTTPT